MKPIHAAIALPAIALIVSASPVAAQIIESPAEMLICAYATECYEEEPCTFAQFGHDVDLPAQLPGAATFLLGTGPAEGQARVVNDVLVVTGSDGNAAYMLSNRSDGKALLSVQIADPLSVVTYHGTCVVPE